MFTLDVLNDPAGTGCKASAYEEELLGTIIVTFFVRLDLSLGLCAQTVLD